MALNRCHPLWLKKGRGPVHAVAYPYSACTSRTGMVDAPPPETVPPLPLPPLQPPALLGLQPVRLSIIDLTLSLPEELWQAYSMKSCMNPTMAALSVPALTVLPAYRGTVTIESLELMTLPCRRELGLLEPPVTT